MLNYLVLPEVMIEGPYKTDVGSTVTIRCNILEGYPLPSVYIITPRGQIDQSTTTFNATKQDIGSYTCIASNSLATVTSSLLLIVYGMYVRMYVYDMASNVLLIKTYHTHIALFTQMVVAFHCL